MNKDILNKFFDISKEIVEIEGRNKISIRGKMKILDYGKEKIYLKLKDYNLKIEGERLYISTFFKESISIEGKIKNLEIIDREVSKK